MAEEKINREEEETEAHLPDSPRQQEKEGSLFDWARSLVSAVVAVVLVFLFVTQLITVQGPSMQNTLYTGDRILVLNSLLCDFQPGDVVVVNAYNAPLDETLVKRIIAVGGQTVDIDFITGTVYVDGEALDEPYIKEPTYTADGISFPLTLEEDEVFIMGDNRNHSTDSRSIQLGPVKEGYIQGKAVFLLFPGVTPDTGTREWSRIGLID